MALTDEQKKMVLQFRAKGMGYRLIGKELGTTRDQVRDYCKTKTAIKLAKEMGISLPDISVQNTRETKLYKCKYCGEMFYVKDSEINSVLYCSSRCKREQKNKRARETREKKKTICKVCGKTFIRNGAQKLCSNECRYETRICKNCGKEFRTVYSSSKKFCSRRCAKIKERKSHEQYYKEFSRIHKGQVVPITKYNGNKHDITIYCLECNKKTTRRADRFVRDRQGCEHCGRQLSVGEKIIEQYLIDNDVKYESQYIPKSFGDIKYRYDFAILNEDGTVLKLIEYDGRQHFEPVEDFGGEKEFKKQVERDVFKERAAREKGIELIRISYKEKNNIYKILEGLCI